MRWLMLAGLLAGCVGRQPPLPSAAPRYLIGAPYQAGGQWYYPRESFGYDATGLAEVLPDRTGLTANGERWEASAMAAAHRTLQLPAIALVTNLENGREIRVRIDERGPTHPGRILGLTRRSAELLGVPGLGRSRTGAFQDWGVPGLGAARVRVQVESLPSQALRDQLQGGPAGVTAAPRGAVTAESLAPPPGVTVSAGARVAFATAPAGNVAEGAPSVPDRLPETVVQGTAQPGQLWIAAGRFDQALYANQVKAKLYALPVMVERVGAGRPPSFRVMAGPFASVGEADAALDRARVAGVTDAEIVVE